MAERSRGLESGHQPKQLSRAAKTWAVASASGVLVLGAWAFFFPDHFFVNFPISGTHWVSTLGDFNDHLMRDYGSAQIGLGIIGVLVATRARPESLMAVMAGYVVFGALHLGYHLTTFDHFSPGSAAAQAIALTTFIVIPLGVIREINRTS